MKYTILLHQFNEQMSNTSAQRARLYIEKSYGILLSEHTDTRWWFQILVIFTLPGEMIQFYYYFSNGLKPPPRIGLSLFYPSWILLEKPEVQIDVKLEFAGAIFGCENKVGPGSSDKWGLQPLYIFRKECGVNGVVTPLHFCDSCGS